MQLLGGFQLPRHLPLALASIIPLLLGTSGHHGPAPCVRLGCPMGRGGIHLALERLAHAHILLLRDCHAQKQVSSPLSWGCSRTGVMQGGRCPASLTGNRQSSETSVCPFVFEGVPCEGCWDVQTGVFPSGTRHWVWADDFSFAMLPFKRCTAPQRSKIFFFFLLSKSKFYRLGHLSIPSYVVLFILNCNEGQTEEGIRSDRRFCLCFWGDVCCPRGTMVRFAQHKPGCKGCLSCTLRLGNWAF